MDNITYKFEDIKINGFLVTRRYEYINGKYSGKYIDIGNIILVKQ